MRVWIPITILALTLTAACGREPDPGADGEEEVQVDEDLGTLRVLNQVNEPVAIHLEGQELFAVPPGTDVDQLAKDVRTELEGPPYAGTVVLVVNTASNTLDGWLPLAVEAGSSFPFQPCAPAPAPA